MLRSYLGMICVLHNGTGQNAHGVGCALQCMRCKTGGCCRSVLVQTLDTCLMPIVCKEPCAGRNHCLSSNSDACLMHACFLPAKKKSERLNVSESYHSCASAILACSASSVPSAAGVQSIVPDDKKSTVTSPSRQTRTPTVYINQPVTATGIGMPRICCKQSECTVHLRLKSLVHFVTPRQGFETGSPCPSIFACHAGTDSVHVTICRCPAQGWWHLQSLVRQLEHNLLETTQQCFSWLPISWCRQ